MGWLPTKIRIGRESKRERRCRAPPEDKLEWLFFLILIALYIYLYPIMTYHDSKEILNQQNIAIQHIKTFKASWFNSIQCSVQISSIHSGLIRFQSNHRLSVVPPPSLPTLWNKTIGKCQMENEFNSFRGVYQPNKKKYNIIQMVQRFTANYLNIVGQRKEDLNDNSV